MNLHVNPVMQSALATMTMRKYEIRCRHKIVHQTIEVSAISEHAAMQAAKTIFARLNPPTKRDEVRVVSVAVL